jgi:hypothetical protein
MKSLFDNAVVAEVNSRINNLNADSPAVWGKMSVSQMFAHCTAALQYACGDYPGKQMMIGKLIGSFLKKNFSNEKPFGKNSPTAPEFTISDNRQFEKEKEILTSVINRFSTAGEQGVTKSPHLFFGKLSPEEWGIGMYKHLDHHFRQFGV